MQILVNNTLSGQRWVESFEESVATIGRRKEQSPDQHHIMLPSRFVHSIHAKLFTNGNGEWLLEHLGSSNDTLINSKKLNRNHSYDFSSEDEITIGEFTLRLFETRKKPFADLGKTTVKLLEVEQSIHTDLLKKMDIRRGDSSNNLESPEMKDRIIFFLNELLDSSIHLLDAESKDKIFESSLYKKLSRKITMGEHQNKFLAGISNDKNSTFQAVYDSIEIRMVAEFGFSLDERKLENDINLLDEKFQEVRKHFDLEFSRGLKEYLVRDLVKQDIIDLVYGLGPLQDLLDMDSVSEIMVVAKDQIFIEQFGIVENSRRSFFNDEMLIAVIERIVSPVGRRIDKSSPLVDARLPDGSRVNAIIPPLAVKGPCVTIRKFSKVPLEIEDLIGFGALTEQMSKFLKACVVNSKNIVVSGGTGTGENDIVKLLVKVYSLQGENCHY